jgi:hypothetical protein
VRAYAETLSPPRRWLYLAWRHVDRNPVASVASLLLAISVSFFMIVLWKWLDQTMKLQPR